jgi:hypothetical protein
VPVAAKLAAGLPGVTAPGRPVALVVDGQLWILGSAQAAGLNSSAVSTITTQQYDAYPRGGDLSGLRY